FIQPDGKILVAGVVDGRAGVARLLANGAADTSFSGDGFATFPQFDVATGVRVSSAGKVVVSGFDYDASNTAYWAAGRLNANGSADTSFSGDGAVTLSYRGSATAVAAQSDGKVVVVGTTFLNLGPASGSDIGAIRLTSSGAYDNTFSGDGRFGYDYSTDDACDAVDLTPDGKILLGITINQNTGGALRLTTGGAVDLAVQDENVAVVKNITASVRDIRSSFDGSQFYLFVSEVNSFNGSPVTSVARFDSDGTRDLTFGHLGQIDGSGESVGDLTADGKLVTAGNPVPGPPDSLVYPDYTKLVARRRLTTTPAADRVFLDENIVVEGTTGNDTVRVTRDVSAATITVTLNGASKVFADSAITRVRVDGGLGDDDVRFVGTHLKADVNGGYGNDYILTDAGGDAIHGNAGNDTINSGDGDDYVDAGDGDDVVNGGALGNDQLYGGRGKDRLFGYAGNDRLCGAYPGEVDAAADYLDGGAGTDTVVTKEGLDAVSGIEKFE
ncbi:MAG TPA: hypothetical protein VF796_23405, partial [Humisphaera sp.]